MLQPLARAAFQRAWGGGGINRAKMPAFAPLDKSHLTQLTHEERTFHIFYQFLAGAVPQEHNHFTPKNWIFISHLCLQTVSDSESTSFNAQPMALRCCTTGV